MAPATTISTEVMGENCACTCAWGSVSDAQRDAHTPRPGFGLRRRSTPAPAACAPGAAGIGLAAAGRAGTAAGGRGLAVLLGAGVVLWYWAGSDTSLASALSQAAHYLPAGQRLESRAVSGSPRRGGGRGGAGVGGAPPGRGGGSDRTAPGLAPGPLAAPPPGTERIACRARADHARGHRRRACAAGSPHAVAAAAADRPAISHRPTALGRSARRGRPGSGGRLPVRWARAPPEHWRRGACPGPLQRPRHLAGP